MRCNKFYYTLFLSLSLSAPCHAVTLHKAESRPFLYDITTFTTTISLPLKDTKEIVRIPLDKIKSRLDESIEDKTVEPLSVTIGPEERQIVAVAERIARIGKEDDLIRYLGNKYDKSEPIKSGSPNRMVIIDKDGYELVNPSALSDMFAKNHHRLTVDVGDLEEEDLMRRKLLHQIKPFMTKSHYRKLKKALESEETIDVDEYLLPEFARSMVRNFVIYRGPNCFHAALAFQSPKLTASSLINVKVEKEYHRAMINYDELWRAINQNFYEIDPDAIPLKYGDMVVFFDVPKDFEEASEVNFKWIRHATTYLFNHYTFSKGSKSPNSPYTVRTLSEEWHTWKKFTKNLGVKVFRRNKKRVKMRPPKDLVDWIY